MDFNNMVEIYFSCIIKKRGKNIYELGSRHRPYTL